MSQSIAEHFKNNPLPQEKKFQKMAKRFGLSVSTQVPIGPYVVDFVSGSFCIEIDSTSKWGTERRKAAAKKDVWLSDRGFKVIRINKDWLSDSNRIWEILLAHNLIRE
jgi:very-short-patch-repair endonuclease